MSMQSARRRAQRCFIDRRARRTSTSHAAIFVSARAAAAARDTAVLPLRVGTASIAG
jgi:hypothetical protein